MVAAVVIIGKINQRTLVVKVENWLNLDMYSIDAQDPYTGDTMVSLKSAYKVGWLIDEHGEPNYSF
jgi:hypothetical protein